MSSKKKANETEETIDNANNAEEVETTETEVEVEEAEVEVILTKEEQLEQEVAKLKDVSMRQAAEFDNFKKRTAREKLELSAFTKANCFTEILNTLDNFERAMNTECKDESYKQGIEMVFNSLKQAVQSQGIEEIETDGVDFDPQYHNAIKQIEDENLGDNKVAEILQKGYKIGDKVIRHAMVVVANP